MVELSGIEPLTSTLPVLYDTLLQSFEHRGTPTKPLAIKGLQAISPAYALFLNVTRVIIHVAPVLTERRPETRKAQSALTP
tara:strand:- start:1843 stop:2085 length:243 start_codon:yes stop_codon:yes gene_type:complete